MNKTILILALVVNILISAIHGQIDSVNQRRSRTIQREQIEERSYPVVKDLDYEVEKRTPKWKRCPPSLQDGYKQ